MELIKKLLQSKKVKSMLERACKTFFQVIASSITVGASIGEIDWKYVLSCAIVAAIYSIATTIGFGTPELKKDK